MIIGRGTVHSVIGAMDEYRCRHMNTATYSMMCQDEKDKNLMLGDCVQFTQVFEFMS